MWLFVVLAAAAWNFPLAAPSELALPEGFEKLPRDVQEALLLQTRDLQDIQAEIKQYIRYGGVQETRRGYFWAERGGRFRLQYFKPSELVVFDGENLYWYIPENGFSWLLTMPSKKESSLAIPKPFWLKKGATIFYESPWYGPFVGEKEVSFRIAHDKFVYEVLFSRKLQQVIQRKTYEEGQLLHEEVFEEPTSCDGIPFFAKVKVLSYLPRQILSQTHYSHLRCNRGLSPHLFEKPPYPVRAYP
ncbi:MAG: outer membrane lipoprotein carrier protein LolA [Leptospiraceae bacterium]|nr:outer membrane lipoprotein carrier protein LolA [Leptospiraceae bacterium]MDW8306005.1 outer membrane lipoprotein carrier protein LolA [Leptospiraceae bacterium]